MAGDIPLTSGAERASGASTYEMRIYLLTGDFTGEHFAQMRRTSEVVTERHAS